MEKRKTNWISVEKWKCQRKQPRSGIEKEEREKAHPELAHAQQSPEGTWHR